MISSARDTARAMAVCSVTDPVTAQGLALQNLPPWVDSGAWTVSPNFGSTDVSMTISVNPLTLMMMNYLPINFDQLSTTITLVKEPEATGTGGSC
jgi:hypothetical protein